MSVRPREAFEASQQFSLRSALGGRAEPAVKAAPPAPGLTFDLGSLQARAPQVASPASLPAPGLPANAPSGLCLRFTALQGQTRAGTGAPVAPNVAPVPMNGLALGGAPRGFMGTPAVASAEAHGPSVMRLTAQVEELALRLKKAQSKLSQTEAQLTRTSHVLCHERQASEKAIAAYKHDVLGARETESKLRQEVASAKKSSLKSSAFLASVDSALASDEQIRAQQRSMQELETKVQALGDFKVKLETEVTALQIERNAVQKTLDEVRVNQEEHSLKAQAATAEMVAAKAAFAEMQKQNDDLGQKIGAARIEEATVAEQVGGLHVTREVMETENASVQASIDALMVEHGDASRSLSEVKQRLSDIGAKEAAANEALKCSLARATAAESAAVAAEAAAAANTPVALEEKGKPSVRRRSVISGAHAPARNLCQGLPTESIASQEAHKACCDSHVASTLAIDCPVGLSLLRVAFVGANHCMVMHEFNDIAGAPKQEEDRTTAMVNAVVGDLKARLTEISTKEPAWRVVAPLA